MVDAGLPGFPTRNWNEALPFPRKSPKEPQSQESQESRTQELLALSLALPSKTKARGSPAVQRYHPPLPKQRPRRHREGAHPSLLRHELPNSTLGAAHTLQRPYVGRAPDAAHV